MVVDHQVAFSSPHGEVGRAAGPDERAERVPQTRVQLAHPRLAAVVGVPQDDGRVLLVDGGQDVAVHVPAEAGAVAVGREWQREGQNQGQMWVRRVRSAPLDRWLGIRYF